MERVKLYAKGGVEREVELLSGGSVSASRWTLPSLEYFGEWMGESHVTVSFRSPVPIDFAIGDYLLYRGEPFVINYDPSVIKKARRETTSDGFVYDNVRFFSLSYELTDVQMLDYVLSDNHIHYTGLPTFDFFCADIDDFADRIQANVDRWCASNGLTDTAPWVIVTPNLNRTLQRCSTVGMKNRAHELHTQYYGSVVNDDEKTNQNVHVSKNTVWDVLKNIKDLFGLSFVFRGRALLIGCNAISVPYLYKYGKGNGLYEIERNTDSSQQVVTMLYAYGSDKNVPVRYYANLNMTPYLVVDDIAVSRGGDLPYVDFVVNMPFRASYFTKPSEVVPPRTWYELSLSFDGHVVQGFVDDTSDTLYIHVSSSYVTNTPSAVASFMSGLSAGSRVLILSGVDKDKWPPSQRDYTQQNIPNNMSIERLMLPGFPDRSLHDWCLSHGGRLNADGSVTWRGYTALFSKEPLRPYIQSLKSKDYGIREATKYFDGSDGDEDIYPTIEGSGYDAVVRADAVSDNGIAPSSTEFKITLPDLGADFDLKSLLQSGTAIELKSGYCSGRSFSVKNATRDGDGNWVCTCEREHDSSLDLYFPYSYSASINAETGDREPYQVYTGDKYVLTGIELTETYVNLNAEKLLEHALKWLSKNEDTRYTYIPKIDEIAMAYEHDAAEPGTSIHDTIKEGSQMHLSDDDLGFDGSIYIDTLRIKEYGNGQIPTYEVTLRDEKQVSTIQRVQDQIANLTMNGNGASVDLSTVRNMVRLIGDSLYLSKVNNDTAAGLIHFVKGLTVGNGFGIDANGRAILDAVTSKNFLSGGFGGAGFGAYLDENGVSTAEVDKLIVRMKAVFNELEIKKRTYSGGNIIFSSAGNKVLEVLPMDSDGKVQRDENGELVYDGAAAYRCLWLMQDGEEAVENTWSVDDQARCETFNIKGSVYENVSNRYYWRKVLALGDSYEYSKDGHSDIYNYIDLAAGINGTYLGNAYTKGMQDVEPVDIPKSGDDIVQVGNQNPNKRSRQNLIEIIVNDTNAPAIMYYEGVNDYSFDGKLIRGDYYDPMTHRFKTVTYGDSYVGDKAQTTYVKYTQDGGAEFKGKVHIEAGSTMSDEFINQIAGDINVSVDMPDITEEVDKALDTLDTGNENLLRNSAFIGEWVDEEPTAVEIMKDTDEMWSRHIKYWTVDNVKIEPCSYVASATAATLGDENGGGTLKQTVEAEIEEGATYCFSLRGVSLSGGNNTITMTFAGVERTIVLDSVMTRQVVKFVALIPELNTFTLTGKGTVAELMLNKGAVPNTDWIPSPQDNPRALSKYKELAYMRTSIFEASTDILGGLVLTQMLKVGNYRDKAMIEETGGMSGLMTSPHSPYLWGGGTLEQAFDTIAKYAQNPRYQPTQEEVAQMAQFVVTHGGRAILNEAVVRGTVYATNGVFKGRVEASEGVFKGRVEASEGEFHGKIYADEGEFGGLVYTPWKWYYEADGNRFYKENTVIYTFKDVGDDISNDLNIIFGNDSIDENTKNIMFYVSLPTSPKYANKTIKIFSPDYFYDTLNIHKEVFNGVSVSMPTIMPSSFGNLRSAPFIYGLSCEDDSDHYRATTIEFDTGILSLSSIIVPDLFAEGGERCAWYVESFTYRRAVITGDGGVKWGNGRGNFGGKRT